MREVVYAFLGFAHQIPVRSTLAGIAIYNGENIRDLGYVAANFFDNPPELVRLTFSGHRNYELFLPSGTTFYNPNTYAVTVTPDGFTITDAHQNTLSVPYIICDSQNVIAGHYVFDRTLFPDGFNRPGSWSVSTKLGDVGSHWISMLRCVSKLPEAEFDAGANKTTLLSHLAALGLNIAKWLDKFDAEISDEDERQQRMDAAISAAVNLICRQLSHAEKLAILEKLDDEGLPEECATCGTSFEMLIDCWLRSLLWNTVYDFCNFHIVRSRHLQTIPLDLGGRLFNHTMPRFY